MQFKTIDLIDTDHWNIYITTQTFVGVGFNIGWSDGFYFSIVIPFIAIGVIHVK